MEDESQSACMRQAVSVSQDERQPLDRIQWAVLYEGKKVLYDPEEGRILREAIRQRLNCLLFVPFSGLQFS